MTSELPNTGLHLTPIRYRDWLISMKMIDQKPWLRWQHPKENFPRYSYPITERGLSDTIHYARFLIDAIIALEEAES